MSGPALNPIASIAPAAPPKGLDASSPDAAAPSEPDKGGTGFASELQRQMKGSPPPDDGQGSKSASDTDTDSDAAARAEAAAQAQPPAQPELAALLGGLLPAAALPPAEPAPAASGEGDTAPISADTSTLPGGGLFALPTALTPEAISRSTGGNAEQKTAESAVGAPANFAATPGKGEDIAPHGAPTALADAPLRAAEPPVAAPPTNSFAAIHAAALANLQGAAPPQAPAPVPMHVATPAGSPGWPEEVGNRVSWMVGQAESHAELTLTPPQLGKVEVSITVSGDQTSAQFVAATPAARELIEQSLPRLREILEQSGISLGQTDVGTSGQPGDPERSPRGSQWRGGGSADEGLATNAVPAQWARRGEGLVDTFA
ncbi:flagellar hook-length control protein FliK [Zoogloea sp.]|uniref:flagellar hook-length control protein FliK n=1 Tax=Zoogloea sp. TaxID=49181 RepID=UPI0025EF3F86|nr:flagellar hook-length control protein FliK [Zoogloea sp.]MCK6392829.1 flagellar hook-length control protein FliK [Zoogloea sp.]